MKIMMPLIYIALILTLLTILLLFWFVWQNYSQKGEINWSDQDTAIISINGKEINAQVSASLGKKSQGLSGVDFMEQNEGMLFIFGTSQALTFSMREMKFPLDFVWINDYKIVRTDENISHPKNGEEPKIISPSKAIDMVLELNAGTVDRLSIKEGDNISIHKLK